MNCTCKSHWLKKTKPCSLLNGTSGNYNHFVAFSRWYFSLNVTTRPWQKDLKWNNSGASVASSLIVYWQKSLHYLMQILQRGTLSCAHIKKRASWRSYISCQKKKKKVWYSSWRVGGCPWRARAAYNLICDAYTVCE